MAEPRPSGVGLQGRLLAGLAVLVLVAIASAGFLTVRVARGQLEAAEEARARGLGAAVAGVLGRDRETGPPSEARARMAAAARDLVGLGGITEVVVVDGDGRPIVGDPGAADAGLQVALGGGLLARRDGAVVTAFAPIRDRLGGRAGAVRLRISVGATMDEAVAGSMRWLVLLTLVDGALILAFGFLFVRGVVRPIREVARAARRVAEGDLDGPRVPPSPGEPGELASAFNRMTEALREQRASLAASREQVLAQEKLATVGRLAAGVAHEIGNPLTAVLGYVELLLGGEKSPASRELLERVRNETARIHQIVHELLDYARPQAGDVEAVPVRAVVEQAVALLRPQPRFRAVDVTIQCDEALAASASAPRLLQVFLNLLLNAADAMAGEGRVTVRARRDGARVVVDVEDSGPGVAPDLRDRLFDPFFTTKEPGAGTGLGLAVCRSILSAWGGEIALAPPSESGSKGACFRVSLRA